MTITQLKKTPFCITNLGRRIQSSEKSPEAILLFHSSKRQAPGHSLASEMGKGQSGRLSQFLFRVRRWAGDELDDRQDGPLVHGHPKHNFLQNFA